MSIKTTGAVMKQQAVDFLKFLANQVVDVSHRLQNYFKNGSFGVAVYPFLLHPCVRKTGRFLLLIIAVLASFMGVFYIFGEFVSAVFSEAFLGAYFKHTTLELLVPIGTSFGEKESDFSPLYTVMSAVFSLQGMCFWLIYAVAINHLSRCKYWLPGTLFALFFSLGMFLITSAQGKFGAGGLQNLGTSLTYLFGASAVFIAGIDFVKPHLQFIRRFSIRAGLIGALCVLFTLFFPNSFTPVLERAGIYAVIVWEILIGFALLKRK